MDTITTTVTDAVASAIAHLQVAVFENYAALVFLLLAWIWGWLTVAPAFKGKGK
jgi:hypothetical protein